MACEISGSIRSPTACIAPPARAPTAPVLIDLPTAVESSLPCKISFVALAKKPATAPPSGPPAIAAADVRIATATVAFPGFAFAQSLTAFTAPTTFESLSPIFCLSSLNLASIFCTGPAFLIAAPRSSIFLFIALATLPTASAPLPIAVLLEPAAVAPCSMLVNKFLI